MNQATIWSKSDCQYCVMAETLLRQAGYQYQVKKLGVDYTKDQLLERFPGARTVPQIEIDGQPLGGYTELRKHLENHKESR